MIAKIYICRMSQGPIDEMARDFAEAAVEMARAMKIELDYSEQSLERVEQILSQLHDEARDLRIAESANRAINETSTGGGPNATQMDDMCKLWGSYFGEVVRRRWGGEWSIETYPGAAFATLALTVTAGTLYPSMKVFRRLTQGESESVWNFYQTVKARLSKNANGTVQ